MPSAAYPGAGSPLIAGAFTPNDEFHHLSDHDIRASNLFDFSNNPDTLQSLDVITSSKDHDIFLNPQQMAVGPLPDSPNGSFHDSSSESAESSSKRTASATPAKTSTPLAAADASMTDDDWGAASFVNFDDDDDDNDNHDNSFDFAAATQQPALNGFYGFPEHDDGFMDKSFDFENASSSPDALSTATLNNMPSPGMPTIEPTSPPKTNHMPAEPSTLVHKNKPSSPSVASSRSGIKRSHSRELSPMSNLVTTSHDSSPVATAFVNSPPNSSIKAEFFPIMGPASLWPLHDSRLRSALGPDAIPSPAPFMTNAMAHARPMMVQPPMTNFNPPAPFRFSNGYQLRILPTPLKSRVETQIPIKMTLSPLPPGVTKLHLPAHTISKPKLMAKPSPDPSPDTLVLHVSLVCTSAMENKEWKKKALQRARTQPQGSLPDLNDDQNSPQNGGEVRICAGCITRERKRAARKKIKKPDEEKVWSLDEERRVIVFNTPEVKEWQPLTGVLDSNGRPQPVVSNHTMQIDAPMRIACYCRHHGEKMGFNVIFTIRDYQDRTIAQAMSNPVMITDDHKTHPMAQLTAQPPMSDTVASTTMPTGMDSNVMMPTTGMDSDVMMPTTGMDSNAMIAPIANNPGFRIPQCVTDVSSAHHNNSYAAGSNSGGKTTPTTMTTTNMAQPPRPHSRPGSPTQGVPVPKRRKASNSRVPNGLEMTRLDTSSPQSTSHPTASQISSAASPFSPPLTLQQQQQQQQVEHLFGVQSGQLPFANGPPTPNSNIDQTSSLFANNRSASMENLALANMYSTPTSSHTSRAPSPSGLGASAQRNPFAVISNALFAPANAPRIAPVIHKIIPNEGPKIGGIEVTVLGAAFFQGLEVWFGDQRATTTTFWGESSLVCLLPPSAVSGPVPVTLKLSGLQPQHFAIAKQPPTFKYVDDNEDKLIRTALSVLGQKMSGQMVDVSDLARRILNDGSSGSGGWGGGGGVSGTDSTDNGPRFRHPYQMHVESQLLKLLDLIDLDNSVHTKTLDLRRPTGHTMLHLACSLGYHRLVAALLTRGANPDARDNGGFTALHMASIQSHSEIIRRLIIGGADPTIRSLSGLTAADVAQSRAVVRAIHSSKRHARSRSSVGSVHSRTSSPSSTTYSPPWEPLTRVKTLDEGKILDPAYPLSVASGEESPEYTSGDFDDESDEDDADENNNHDGSRRASETSSDNERLTGLAEDTEQVDASSPSAIAAALKDQFQQQLQQIQQTMAMHLQNFAHMPQLPQMPGRNVLPDYQGYLQRMQQYMPGMSGSRPGLVEEDRQKVDGRWWDLSSYMGNTTVSPALPPAYDEIFPPKMMEEKQRAAAEAAAEARADRQSISTALCNEQSSTTRKNKRLSRSSTETFCDEETTTTTTSSNDERCESPIPSVLKIGRKNAITKEQQDQFLRAREEKLKRLGNDRKLFLVWIPLLLVMICAMLYSYYPRLFPCLFESATAVIRVGYARGCRYWQHRRERVY